MCDRGAEETKSDALSIRQIAPLRAFLSFYGDLDEVEGNHDEWVCKGGRMVTVFEDKLVPGW